MQPFRGDSKIVQARIEYDFLRVRSEELREDIEACRLYLECLYAMRAEGSAGTEKLLAAEQQRLESLLAEQKLLPSQLAAAEGALADLRGLQRT